MLPDPAHPFGWLRVGRDRPRHGGTAKQPSELAPPHRALPPVETSERADVITLGRRVCVTANLAADVSIGSFASLWLCAGHFRHPKNGHGQTAHQKMDIPLRQKPAILASIRVRQEHDRG